MEGKSFEGMLQGGHPNSLGRTLEVVEILLLDPGRMDELFNCYTSEDEVVRLRVSNAMKRLMKANKALILPYIGRLISEISLLDQPSAQWTLAQLFLGMEKEMSREEKEAATAIMKRNLSKHEDWIVLTQTMETLAHWAKEDEKLRAWLLPQLKRLQKDHRKSVSGKAEKSINQLIL